jgi:hypothetical protein
MNSKLVGDWERAGKVVADFLDRRCQSTQGAISKPWERPSLDLPDQIGMQEWDDPGCVLLANKSR